MSNSLSNAYDGRRTVPAVLGLGACDDHLLAPVYGAFFDTPDLKDARAMLDNLA